MERSLRFGLLIGSFFLLALGLLGGIPHAASAAEGSINRQINYQGKLMDANGAIVPDGTYDMSIALYDLPTGGTPLWNTSGTPSVPTQIPVTVNNGLFTVMLGDTSASGQWQNAFSTTTIWNRDTLYIGVTVEGDAEMTPRKRIGAVPQAFNAAQLQGMAASGTTLGETLFGIHRGDTGTSLTDRSALDVQTSGEDTVNDYIARFYGPGSTPVAYLRNDGHFQAAKIFSGYTSTTGPVIAGFNTGEKILGNTWGGAFNSLVVGTLMPENATGTFDMSAVIKYSGNNQNALCLDDITTNSTCSFLAGSSLISDGTINASAFDLAERYSVTGDAEPGDLLVADPNNPLFVRKSSGVSAVTRERLVGIVSTKPGLLLGDLREGVSVALSGRVPTHVSVVNGSIAIGDALTASMFPGVAMKATGPGQIVGYALAPASTTSTIEVFVKVGYDANGFLGTDGQEAIAQGSLVLNAKETVNDLVPAADSWGITWRGNLWDGLQSVRKDFSLFTKVAGGGASTFQLMMGTSTLWSVDEEGSMAVTKDLFLGGRFFPATRNGAQSEKYLFLDDTGPASSTYIATNADGWQANTSYDFAERYYSPDALEPGDVVVLSQRGRFHVQRSAEKGAVPIGIVSTRPAFVAGAPAPDTYPIALVGRVPTYVSGAAGAIAVGDPLTASTLPGVAVKATEAGPIVGYALEAYEANTVSKIEVFVSAQWWGGPSVPKIAVQQPVMTNGMHGFVPPVKSYQGLARILAGATTVKVVHPPIGTFPLVQVTPYGKVTGQWWTDNSTERGFEITLEAPLLHDVTFNWRAEEMRSTDSQLFLSNEQLAQWDIYKGQPVWPGEDTRMTPLPPQPETLPEVVSLPVQTPPVTEQGNTSSTPPLADEVADEPTDEEALPADESAEDSTEPIEPEDSIVIPEIEPVVIPEPEEVIVPEPVVEAAPQPAPEPVTPPTPDPVPVTPVE